MRILQIEFQPILQIQEGGRVPLFVLAQAEQSSNSQGRQVLETLLGPRRIPDISFAKSL